MSTEFVCPICKAELPREALIDIAHTEKHIVEAIKKSHPKWAEASGVCKKCYEYYKSQMQQK